jgi:glycosyltransferase involved in cell wall biosynthesis
MVEVLRILKDEYDFAVVTSERLAKHQGSLHHQVDELGIPIFDLAEAAEPDEHLFLLDVLKRHFRPNLVWICNGSPWLADNADQIRRVFANIPIVDQQVYDTEHGWVNRYRERGIQSFDRFIATTRKIMNKFEVEIGIPRNRIDLIYSSIDSRRLEAKEGNLELQHALRLQAGMPLDARIYAFIGRLTPQKRPLEYLELAKRAANHEFRDRFMLIGDGELRDACENYIVREGLKNVTTIRYCEDLSGVVNMIDGLIITSEFEGLPIALLETLALGRPALATNVGDIDVVLNEHESGIVVPLAGGSEALWEGFQRWRESLPFYRRNAQTHAAAIRERFSNLKIAAEYSASWAAAIGQARRENIDANEANNEDALEGPSTPGTTRPPPDCGASAESDSARRIRGRSEFNVPA